MKEYRLLLVDDEQEIGEVLSLRLARRGFAPQHVTSSEAALKLLEKEEFDAAILDVKMPGMDGMELLKILIPLYPKMAVIMLSGHADMDVAAEGLALGAFCYQLKPVDITVLCHKIEDACRQKELEQFSSEI